MGWISFASGGGGANQNLNNTYERGGWDANGESTTITSSASSNTLGNYTQIAFAGTAGVTVNAFAGFWLYIARGGASTVRILMDLSFDGGTTVHVPQLYFEPNQTTASFRIWIPLAVSAGADIRARIRASVGSGSGGTVRAAIVGVVSNSQSAPMFTVCERINTADTTNTRASTTDVPLQGSGGTTYTDLDSSLDQTYGAFLISPSYNGTNPAAQECVLSIATGAASSETEVYAHGTFISATSAAFTNRPLGWFEKSIASTTRLSVKPIVPTPGTDNIRVACHGFR